MRRAVIDVGSNSLLLLVAELRDGAWIPIHEAIRVTALGEGVKATGLLSEASIIQTLEALREMFATAKELGAKSIRAAATMAARIATNTPEFQARAASQGTPVEILSGEDEAELGFQAVAEDPILNQVARLSIVDPGGNSTELTTADREQVGWKVRFQRSYPVGTLGLRGALPESPGSLDLLRTCGEIDDLIGLCYRPDQCGQVVVLGASGTNLVSIRDRLTTWQPDKVHGATLGYEEISRAAGWLSAMTDAERAAVPGMEPGRERTIHLGALVLERFLFALRADQCRVSVRGWRHALLERS